MNPAPGEGPAPPAGPPKYLPVSFAQQRLWFLDQLMPGNPFYNEHTCVRLDFRVNMPALERSLTEIAQRHETLRTTFVAIDGQPVQVIAATGSIPLVTIDVCHLAREERAAAATRLASEEAARPFDLRRGPLARATLIRLDDCEHLFLVTMHHIVSDGWSLGVFGRELQAVYSAFELGHPSPLKPLSIQYGDFAVWQRKRLTGAVLDQHVSYWTGQLADAPVLELPTDHPRPPVPTFRGGVHTVTYPTRLLAALRHLSHREDVTLFMTLLAGFQLLLSRYSGQEDIVVGVPIANRSRSELEALIGFFVNTLALRTRLSGDPTVRELLARVRAVALEAYAHQDLPFEKLVEELHPRRDLARNPVFQVVLQLFNAPGAAPAVTSAGRVDEVGASAAKFDLTVHLAETSDGLYARFEYSLDLFDPVTIERMADQYGHLLAGMAAQPDARVFDLPMMSADEERLVTVDWNRTATAYPGSSSLQTLFERQAALTPDAVAIEYGPVALTYREVNRRANRLALALRAAGVGPDVLVAVALEPSVEMVVATLAVIKAGGAYVPIDPAYPDERVAFIMADTRACVLVTRSHLRDRLPAGDAAILSVDSEWPGPSGDADDNVAGGATADSLAYVMYTSGSTGIPKGVAVTQRAVARLVFATNYVSLGPSDRIAQVSNVSFDAATFEIWGALLNGATLVGITRGVALAPGEFAADLRRQRITTMFLTTALFNHVAAEVPDAFATLKTLLVGGEALDPRWVAHVLEHRRPERLLNAYGPTESTTFAACFEVPAPWPADKPVPIGRPISNTQLYVLDPRQRPVAVGVPGELYIGGDGLAREYWNDPQLTSRRFVTAPFTGVASGRLYRTGDRVRWLADGHLVYMGRLDRQLKIRGFRVEPGEVEALLSRYREVRESLVLSREDRSDDRRLVAYVVAPGAPPGLGAQLRQRLKERLPDYMVPAAVVCLDAFPLTANGKVDRAALPPPDATASSGAAAAPSAPVTDLERAIAAVWTEALGVERVGLDDNFFELGGHSLLLAKVHSRLKTGLPREVSMIDLFRYPTVRSLAAHLAEQGGDDTPLARIQARVEKQRRRERPKLVRPAMGGGGPR